MPNKKISNCKICGNIPFHKDADLFYYIKCADCGIEITNGNTDNCIDIWNKLNDNGLRYTIEVGGIVYKIVVLDIQTKEDKWE